MDGLLLSFLFYLVGLFIAIWIAGALFYDVGRGTVAGTVLAVSWLAVTVTAFVLWQPAWKPFSALISFLVPFLFWWFSQRPSNDRDWAKGFTHLPKVHLHNSRLTVENVRNSDYQGIGESTTRYEKRDYQLSNLQGVDALILYWGSSLMSHPMFVFDFGKDGRLCISIEVRYLEGQAYNFIGSIYRQNELIYIVSDERDAILRRTKFQSDQDVYLYRLRTEPLSMLSFFLEYANSINLLAQRPLWYNGVTKNCTTSIYAQGRGRMVWDWRVLFNGTLDRLMYDRQLLDQELTFDDLKEQSRVNDVTEGAPVEGFGDYIRQKLTGYNLAVHNESENAETHEGHRS